MKADRPYLLHIADSIDAILAFAPDRRTLSENRMARDAVLHNFMIVGEAVSKLSPALKAAAPGVPWRKIVEFRNRLVHAYWGLDFVIVGDVIENDLPVLRAEVAQLLSKPVPGAK